MKIKLVVALLCMLLFLMLILTIPTITAGDEENPEIIDDVDNFWNVLPRKNIESAWFFNDGENLFVTLKADELQPSVFYSYTILWLYNEKNYFASMVGIHFYYGYNTGGLLPWRYIETTGSYDKSIDIVTINIPLNEIGNPKPGDHLINTWAMTHWNGPMYANAIIWKHFGLPVIGLNFHLPYDRAPEWGEYGMDYILQNEKGE